MDQTLFFFRSYCSKALLKSKNAAMVIIFDLFLYSRYQLPCLSPLLVESLFLNPDDSLQSMSCLSKYSRSCIFLTIFIICSYFGIMLNGLNSLLSILTTFEIRIRWATVKKGQMGNSTNKLKHINKIPLQI